MKRMVVCLVALISASSWADGLCTRNAMKVDVCRAATDISETIAEELPLRLGRTLVLQHIGASGNLITMRAVFDYPKARLLEGLRDGATLDSLRKSVYGSAMVIACRPNTELQAFIRLGGRLQFVYFFSDKAHFLTVNVDRCGADQDATAS